MARKKYSKYNDFYVEGDKCICNKCGLSYSKYGIKQHLAYTHDGKHPSGMKGKDPWNKGLTKESDQRILKSSKILSDSKKGKAPNFEWTEARRKNSSEKQSHWLIKNYANGKRKQAGGFTKWLVFNNIKVQGSYEFRVCKILDFLKNKKEIIDWEYSKIRVKYYSKIYRKEKTYIVDFFVKKDDKISYLIEVKGRVVPNDLEKWKEARKHYILEVWDNKKIIEMEKYLGL